MYGWPRGIIFSKLAFSVSRSAASAASTTVSTAQIDDHRAAVVEHQPLEPRAGVPVEVLEGARNGQVCVGRGRAWRSPRGAATAAAVTGRRAGRRRRRHPGPSAARRRQESGARYVDRLEARAVVGADQHVAGLADDHDAAVARRPCWRSARPAVRCCTGCQLRPPSVLRSTVPRRPCRARLRALPMTPNSVPL